MALNRYFNTANENSEQELFEDLVIEMIQMNGQDVLYIPREIFEVDPVLQEPKKTVFRRNFIIEAYQPDGYGYPGEQNIMSKFGFRVNQTADFIMSKKRFAELGTGRERPMEGDLIYVGNPYDPDFSLTNTLFEINQVWYNQPDWQFGRHFTYKLVCETWTGSREKFQTGKTALDTMETVSDDSEEPARVNEGIISAKTGIIVDQFDRHNPFGDF
ncbi:neck protein [Xanthomonas phage X1]|nr:neck protein [Xanthomonas phage X1]